jgi:hypothetical protein
MQMNPLLILAVGALPSTAGLLGILIWVAVAVVVVWAVIALVKWSGIPIPQPVWIILTAFIAIALILLIARFFGVMAN